MNRRLRLVGLLAAVAAAALAVPSAAAAGTSSRHTADYGPAARADQCGLPLSQRHGAWECQSAPASTSTTAPGTASPNVATSGTTYCTTNGCWQRGDDFHSNYSADVYFGWNSKNLGYVYIEFDWQLSGRTTYLNPALAIFYPNPGVGILGVDMNASLWNGAPGVANGGSRITSVVWSPHYGPATSYRWTSWSAYDGNNWDHNSIAEIQFTVSGTSGYYYAWARSICSHTTDKAIYRYDSDSSLPGNPTGTGWVS